MNENLPQFKNPLPPPERTTTNETSGEMREGPWRPSIKTTDEGEPRCSDVSCLLAWIGFAAALLCGIFQLIK
ncbi:MAG: hypothetical protein IPJ02_17565 [Chitinophagaceae bacterium]|nr:hypothetical protein [Chitinophagaceae bacterium]